MKSKNNLFLTIILAMALVFGMALIGCDDGSGDDGTGGTGGSGGTGGGGTTTASFAGTWNASGNRSIVFTGNSFTYKVNGTTKYAGTFSASGSTITFYETMNFGGQSASGNFTLSGSTLTLSNHTWDSSVNGTYTKEGGGSGGGGGGGGAGALTWKMNDTPNVLNIFGVDQIWDIAYGANKFVAVGEDGLMAYSPDGIVWTKVTNTTFGYTDIVGIAYGGGRFVAGDINGRLAYSTDGITWTMTTNTVFTGLAGYLSDIIYTGSGFVAIGKGTTRVLGPGGFNFDIDETKIATSSNGTSWTQNGSGDLGINTVFGGSVSNSISSMAYGGNRYVAVGNVSWTGGRIMYATGLTSWTMVADNPFTANGVNDVVYGKDKFVAVGNNGRIAYSTNGTTWTAVGNSTFGTSYVGAVIHDGDKFVAAGKAGKIAYSTDGITWTASGNSTLENLDAQAIAYGGGRFVIVGDYGYMAYSN